VAVWQARVVHAHGALPEWFARLLRERSLQLPKAVWAAGLEAMASDSQFAALGRIRARVRLLLGAEDRLNPRVDAEAISAALRSAVDCELIAIEGAGCVPHWDAPEAVAREINLALAPDGDA
jgi:pimeloyl-ACP methyl ester carboxylesterase